MSETIGLKHIDALVAAWCGNLSTKSNVARSHATEVAELACRGLITTRQATGRFGTEWRITPLGARMLLGDDVLPPIPPPPLDISHTEFPDGSFPPD